MGPKRTTFSYSFCEDCAILLRMEKEPQLGDFATLRPLVLAVDDEASVLDLIQRILSPHVRLVMAPDLQTATRLLGEHPIQIVVCDHRLPDGLGLDFLGEWHRRRPDIVGILITGYSEEALVIEAANSGSIFRYLKKPFSKTLLIQAVQDAVHRHTREAELQQAKRSLEGEGSGNSVAERSTRVVHVVGMLLLGLAILIGGLVVLALLGLLVVYVLKTGMGIDIFKDTHLGDVLFR